MKKNIFFLLLLGAGLATFLLPINARAAAGDLYVASDGAIFKFTPAGTRSTFATDLDQPTALAFDRQANLFVADSGSCVSGEGGDCSRPSIIFRFTPSGVKSTFASVTSPQLLGLAFDRAGNLFAATDSGILRFTTEGTQSTFAPNTNIWGLAFDRAGDLYAADTNGRVLKFSPAGIESTFASGLEIPSGLAFDRQGNLFVDDLNSILKFTPAAMRSTFASQVNSPALAFDHEGNLFVAENVQEQILKFTREGIKTIFASEVNFPTALAFEPIAGKLLNTSARGLVQTGDNALIGGFILGGNELANNSVVLRAIGPSLSKSGIANFLPDPTLALHDASGTMIAFNDNWQESQTSQITASGLAPTDPRESAILIALPAGNFTAIVRGAGGSVGVALMEVYSSN